MSGSRNQVENDGAIYKTLLESTKAIPWRLDWNTMQFTYIGPQIEKLLGWSQASWVSVDDWAERMHPDDRNRVVNFCVTQSKTGIDHEADYRALTNDGGYVWIRDVVHVVRNDSGEVDSLIGFMFDISERKRTEERLVSLQMELEELSFKDGLTGVANRRMFDMILGKEWGNARRSRQPLSVIMLDIDYFKEYNDLYGHIAGDDCLKQVGQILTSVAMRPRDFICRYGGEEFVLILPETDAQAAEKVAERCHELVLKEKILHEKSQFCGTLTVSLGVGTVIPSQNDEPMKFVETVDKRLYHAKQRGRNCTVSCG